MITGKGSMCCILCSEYDSLGFCKMLTGNVSVPLVLELCIVNNSRTIAGIAYNQSYGMYAVFIGNS